jgi:ATP-binding cassette subfamily B multidrug efflux pump
VKGAGASVPNDGERKVAGERYGVGRNVSAPHRGPQRFMGGEKAKDLGGTLRKLLRYMGVYKFALVAVALLAIGATVFSVFGPKVLGNATTVLSLGIVSKVAGTGGIDYVRIGQILLLALVLYATSALLQFGQGWVMTTITQKLCFRMRNDIAKKIDRMPLGYFESHATGDVLSRITNDVDTLGQSLNQSVTTLVTSVVTIVGVVVIMFTINVLMACIVVLVIPLCALVIRFVIKHSQRYFFAQQKYLGAVNGQVEEVFSGLDIIKAFNREEAEAEVFDETNDILYHSAWKSQFFSGTMRPLMDLVSNVAYVAVVISGAALAIRGIVAIGDIQAFIQYVRNLTQPISQLAQVSNMLQATAAAAERVFEFLEEEEETDDAADALPCPEHLTSIEFDHVAFGYDPDDLVIHDLSARIEEGQTIALVGPTGAGKTTTVKLLMRFYDTVSGSIRLNGHDLREYRRADVRSMFGMVLQDTWLFSGSIMENIRYGRLDATDEEVRHAAQLAHADHFIQTLPGGYDMQIDEDAANISQGQRQLITIARAILANRDVLILDEATSSVDTRTEVQIQQAMDTLMEGRTSFVIAHRLSTIRNADLILVIREGDIVEQGTHEELLERNGFYASLYNAQFEDVK